MNWLQVIRLVTNEPERQHPPRTPTGMKNSKTLIKTLAIVLLAGAGLSGCVAVPAYGPGYGPGAYGPSVYSPPVVVAPVFGFGFGGYGGRGYYGGHGRW
jgi:hypothetical protein